MAGILLLAGGLVGRLGSVGGCCSCSGLLGGLLKGDCSGTAAGAGSSRWVSKLNKCESLLLGFSARLIGGGTGGRPLTSPSLLISPERLGGGGEGGPEVAESMGDRRDSWAGFGLGALGILKDRGEGATGVGGPLVDSA